MSAERIVGTAFAVLTRIESGIAVVSLCVSAAALLADIVTRSLLGFGLFGSLRVAVYSTAIAALLGFAVCVSQGAHLRVSILDKSAPEAWQPTIVRLGNLVSFAICAYLGYWAAFYVHQTYLIGETDPSLGIKVWPIQMIMPWMFASGALRYLAYVVFPALMPAERSAAQ